MKATIELSMYPFAEAYKVPIKDFIDELNRRHGQDFHVSTSATSTLISGDYRPLMELLTSMLEWSHGKHGRAVFVAKIIPGLDASA